MNPQPNKKNPLQSNGRIIDFVPRNTKNPKISSQPAQKPVIKMPTNMTTSRPQPKIAPVPRPVVTQTRPISHPAVKPHPITRPQQVTATHTVAKTSQVITNNRPVATVTTVEEEVDFGIIEDYGPIAPEPAPTPAPQAPPLGTRSPFLKSSVIVPKRPLSNNTPIKQQTVPAKPQETTHKITKPLAIKPASRKSKLPLVLLIIGTIIIGAVVGACAYFLVFQGQ